MERNVKITTLICILIGAIIACSALTFALLKVSANEIENTFVNGTVGCDIEEDLTTPGVKKDVKLKNDGTADAYLRACVVINWVDEEGNIYPATPVAGVDYTVVTPETYGFIVDGNLYYCQEPVKAGEESPVLFTSIAPVTEKVPEGYEFTVEILGSAIQSLPATAVEEAWGVTVSEGTIVNE